MLFELGPKLATLNGSLLNNLEITIFITFKERFHFTKASWITFCGILFLHKWRNVFSKRGFHLCNTKYVRKCIFYNILIYVKRPFFETKAFYRQGYVQYSKSRQSIQNLSNIGFTSHLVSSIRMMKWNFRGQKNKLLNLRNWNPR